MMKKYCAFGSVGLRRLGILLEQKNDYIKIKTKEGIEYWSPNCVKIYNTELEAVDEITKWETLTDNR
jgi:hypothetical protein